MKTNTIKLIAHNKHRSWAASITDEATRKIVEDHSILTGGAITSMLLNEPVNDYDFYLDSQEAVTAVASYYAGKFIEANPDYKGRIEVESTSERVRLKITTRSGNRDAGGNVKVAEQQSFNPDIEDAHAKILSEEDQLDAGEQKREADKDKPKEKPTYRPLFITENAITLSDGVQIVLRFFGDAEAIHKNYDFVHCTNYWTSKDNKVTLRPEALESIITRELKYVGSRYPVCSLIRLRKFIKRGWSVTAGQILKIIFQCQNFNLRDVSVLRDQLTGVDTAYFAMFLEALEKGQEKRDGKELDTDYLCALVDKILR